MPRAPIFIKLKIPDLYREWAQHRASSEEAEHRLHQRGEEPAGGDAFLRAYNQGRADMIDELLSWEGIESPTQRDELRDLVTELRRVHRRARQEKVGVAPGAGGDGAGDFLP